jgi:hypothetical protein
VLLAQAVNRPVTSTLPHGVVESEGPVQQPVQQAGSLDALWQHSSSAWIVVACLVLLLVAIVALLGISWYRKRVLSNEEASSSETWTLDDIRRLRAEGSLTEEEYQRLRATIIATYRGREGDRNKPDSSPEKWDWTA